MDVCLPTVTERLLSSQAGIVAPPLEKPVMNTVGGCRPHHYRHEVGDSLKLSFVLIDLCSDPLRVLGDVFENHYPAQELSCVIIND